MWKYVDDLENICYAGSLDEKTNLTDFLPLLLVSNNTFHRQNLTKTLIIRISPSF